MESYNEKNYSTYNAYYDSELMEAPPQPLPKGEGRIDQNLK